MHFDHVLLALPRNGDNLPDQKSTHPGRTGLLLFKPTLQRSQALRVLAHQQGLRVLYRAPRQQ